MYSNLLKVAAFSLLVLAAGCAKDSDPQSLATPELTFQEHSAVEYSFMWKAVEHADSYSYKLETAEGVVVAENATYTNTSVTVSDLSEGSKYNFHVTALSQSDPDYLPSETASVSFTTHLLNSRIHARQTSAFALPGFRLPESSVMTLRQRMLRRPALEQKPFRTRM